MLLWTKNMFQKTNKTLLILGLVTILSSCGYMARELATPNTCKRCEIVDNWGTVVWSEDECGGSVYNMEQRAKAEAYDRGCDYRVNCDTYKKEEENNN